jgi:protein-L-isoaspartate(D-aspartate) O-methyltransferase
MHSRTVVLVVTFFLSALWSCRQGPGDGPPDSTAALRARMVETQIADPMDGRTPVRSPRVLEVMRRVPRHAFVPEDQAADAYDDRPLPIGHEQTISQPYIVAIMTELLDPQPEDVVLEVGTGSGYQAAVLAELVKEVYTIEIVEPLARRAAATLKALGYENVQVRAGDGYHGWPEAAPFDAVLVTAAPDHVPQPLVDQLKVGGKLVIPVGPVAREQHLLVLEKLESGELLRKSVMPVAFVPLTRDDDE